MTNSRKQDRATTEYFAALDAFRAAFPATRNMADDAVVRRAERTLGRIAARVTRAAAAVEGAE